VRIFLALISLQRGGKEKKKKRGEAPMTRAIGFVSGWSARKGGKKKKGEGEGKKGMHTFVNKCKVGKQ